MAVSAGKNSSPTEVSAAAMAQLLQIPAPGILIRSLGPTWMLGVYTNPAGSKSTFVVATNTFFQNSFAGMLQWENVMPDDLKAYLYNNSGSNTYLQVSTSSAQTTLRGTFVDRIISNRDVREFVTSNGQILFLYSFIDNTKLVITGNEETLSAILNRLEKQPAVR